jgi:hypothetical protein
MPTLSRHPGVAPGAVEGVVATASTRIGPRARCPQFGLSRISEGLVRIRARAQMLRGGAPDISLTGLLLLGLAILLVLHFPPLSIRDRWAFVTGRHSPYMHGASDVPLCREGQRRLCSARQVPDKFAVRCGPRVAPGLVDVWLSRRAAALVVLVALVRLTVISCSSSFLCTAPRTSSPDQGAHAWHRLPADAVALHGPTMRLRGGRELPAARGEEEREEGKKEGARERPMPDVSEAMKAKIAKHRQMRKPKPSEDAEQQAKRERQKHHAERRDRRDAQRAASKKLKMQDRKRRPFMRERNNDEKRGAREHGSKAHKPHTAPQSEGGSDMRKAQKLSTAERTAPESKQASERERKRGEEGAEGMAESDKRKAKKLGIAMPARESILRPFWDPQAKGRDLGSSSSVQRQRARERLLQALVVVQREHQRNNTSEQSVHHEVPKKKCNKNTRKIQQHL